MTAKIHLFPNMARAASNSHIAPPQLLLAFAPLHRVAMGVALAVACGGLLSLSTLILVVRGTHSVNLDLLGQFLWGYRTSVDGIFIGLLWGALVGFAFGYSFALLRNLILWLWMASVRSRAEMDHYSDFLDHM
jgi:hypothetical protein